MTRFITTLTIALFMTLAAACGDPMDGAPGPSAMPSAASADAGTQAADAGTQTADVGHDARPPSVPVGRASAVSCPPLPSRPSPGGLTGSCSVDSDCTAGMNGRCAGRDPDGEVHCIYDDCSSDSDCASGTVCHCGVSLRDFSVGNNCLSMGNCRVNSDCGPGGTCSAAVGDASTLGDDGVFGYFCHTPDDECQIDSDCPTGSTGGEPICTYSNSKQHWSCSFFLPPE